MEVALKYGYTSLDSFTRAFRQMHGITPSATKKGGCLLKSYGKITFVNSGYEHAMLPEIEYYSDGDTMAADYKSEIWIPVKE